MGTCSRRRKYGIIFSKKNVLNMGTERERKDTKLATIYELHLIVTGGEKKNCSVEEIVELLE